MKNTPWLSRPSETLAVKLRLYDPLRDPVALTQGAENTLFAVLLARSKSWGWRAQERPPPMSQFRFLKIRTATLAISLALLPTVAFAQTDMSCVDYLEADAEMQAAMSPADKAAMQSDPRSVDLDNKARAYCKANPGAPASEAMSKAMQ
jgi:hypothetical protein